jgi:hypothetical protein
MTLKFAGSIAAKKLIKVARDAWDGDGDVAQQVYKHYILEAIKQTLNESYIIRRDGETKFTIEVTVLNNIPESYDEYRTEVYNPDYVNGILQIAAKVED